MAGPEINNIKNELQQAVEQRQIFIEYDVLAKQINKFPTCSEARIEIETLQKDLDKMESEYQSLEAKINVRQMQFGAIVSSLYDLKHTIRNDQESFKVTDDGTSEHAMELG
jgi:hypothetical protein